MVVHRFEIENEIWDEGRAGGASKESVSQCVFETRQKDRETGLTHDQSQDNLYVAQSSISIE